MKTPKEMINRQCIDKKSFNKLQVEEIVDYWFKRKEIIYYYQCDLCRRYHLSKYSQALKKLDIF